MPKSRKKLMIHFQEKVLTEVRIRIYVCEYFLNKLFMNKLSFQIDSDKSTIEYVFDI